MIDFWESMKAAFMGAMAALAVAGLGTAVVALLFAKDTKKGGDAGGAGGGDCDSGGSCE